MSAAQENYGKLRKIVWKIIQMQIKTMNCILYMNALLMYNVDKL